MYMQCLYLFTMIAYVCYVYCNQRKHGYGEKMDGRRKREKKQKVGEDIDDNVVVI